MEILKETWEIHLYDGWLSELPMERLMRGKSSWDKM